MVFNGTTTYGLCNTFKPFSTSSVTANGVNFEIEATIEFNDDSNAKNKYLHIKFSTNLYFNVFIIFS